MFVKPFDDISSDDIRALVESRVAEGRRVEFKRDHYGRKDDDRREFAADVSAMANASGGDIIVGISEENGTASQVVGVEEPDPDKLVLGVTDSIRSSIEPEIIGFRVRWVAIEGNRGVLIIRIPRSWNAPHRVTVARDNRFFIRDENGKHPMSVGELRRAFLFATELEERVRGFRTERLRLLSANEGPLALPSGVPSLVLHVVPRAAFTEGLQIDVRDDLSVILPLGASGCNSMYSVDGLVTYSGPEERFESVRAFTTLFRNGIVEAAAKIYSGNPNGIPSLALDGIEDAVIGGVGSAISLVGRRGVSAPFYIMLSLVGVRGLSAPNSDWGGGLPFPHRADNVILPELEIDETASLMRPEAFLRPLFDLMWNAFGRRGSPNYDGNGAYGRR